MLEALFERRAYWGNRDLGLEMGWMGVGVKLGYDWVNGDLGQLGIT